MSALTLYLDPSPTHAFPRMLSFNLEHPQHFLLEKYSPTTTTSVVLANTFISFLWGNRRYQRPPVTFLSPRTTTASSPSPMHSAFASPWNACSRRISARCRARRCVVVVMGVSNLVHKCSYHTTHKCHLSCEPLDHLPISIHELNVRGEFIQVGRLHGWAIGHEVVECGSARRDISVTVIELREDLQTPVHRLGIPRIGTTCVVPPCR